MALAVILVLATCIYSHAAPGRYEQKLSGEGWKLWLDHAAVWHDDDIYLPPVDISRLPVNPPSCGWDKLSLAKGKTVAVPGTVEEHYWGEIGGTIPDVGGDYRGVSWWSTEFYLAPDLAGKRIILAFESVNLRAEVFVNEQLVGYDVIGNTQFEVDAGKAVRFGQKNRLDIRITDPVGNFSWNDNILMRWGKNLIPAVHGFGGITGEIVLKAVDDVSVTDIYVQNTPKPKEANVIVSLDNAGGAEKSGNLTVTVHEWKNPAAVVWQKKVKATVPSDGTEISLKVKAPKAKLWELAGHRTYKEAALYEASVRFASKDGAIEDTDSQRFGFRYFTVGEKNGDKRFYLNGKRVFLIAAMTRGFWPKNGIFATPEMAKRDMEALIDMGYNMMLLHRAIGQPPVMEYADRMGLFTYEEPGGYRVWENKEDNITGPDQMALDQRRIKLERMVIRDRSLPSMVIYNLKNEARRAPDEDDVKNTKIVHELDPSRIITYNSDRNRDINWNERVDPDPYKLHMLPFDDTVHYRGWWDHHHWYAWAGYVDFNYNNPEFYLRGVVNGPTAPAPADSLLRLDESEIIFWGEEGAFGTMVRLQKIKERLETDPPTGFRELEHIDWFEHYDRFLDESGFRSAYPTVDDLTLAMGRNMHYFHGRSLENVRMSNIADGYNLNGWGSASTRTDMVDMYRNPTGDPSILAYYSQPLYVAVKIRDKVQEVGDTPVADFWIINEANLKGKATLEITFKTPDGSTVHSESHPVSIKGGEEFGQLLVKEIKLPALKESGYYMLNARITQNGVEKACGYDDIFAVDITAGFGGAALGAIENDGVVETFLKDTFDVPVDTSGNLRSAETIIVGKHDFGEDAEKYREILDKVVDGATLIVLDKADKWAEALNAVSMSKPPTYEGDGIIRRGNQGRLFVGNSHYLAGLPQAQSMGWEYQFFYQTGNVRGLKLHNWGTETIVALGAQHTKEILKALACVRLGQGKVILSTLNMLPALSSDAPQAAVAKKLLLNLVQTAQD